MTSSLESKLTGMVLASFCGDALALGVHWIYDPAILKNDHGRVTGFIKPAPDTFHAPKDKGEFTHYGDQMLTLLASVAAVKGFNLDDFAHRWRALFDNYGGYMDRATKQTLANFDKNPNPETSGSDSEDLAGAVRIAPLVYALHDQPEVLMQAVRAQTRMTHANPDVMEASAFFAQIAVDVLKGRKPSEAMAAFAETGDTSLAPHVQKALASTDEESLARIGHFGRDCSFGSAFPGVVHLVAKYEDNLEEALIQSVMAGGDSAARAMVVGLLLGAYLGETALPKRWVTGLKKEAAIRRQLGLIDAR